MVEHREHDTLDWIHMLVVPSANVPLFGPVAAPTFHRFQSLEQAWRSVLRDPGRFQVLTPTALLSKLAPPDGLDSWRTWLSSRYGT